MKDFRDFLSWRPHTRQYQKIWWPSIWNPTDSIVYLAGKEVFKVFHSPEETRTPVSEEILRNYHRIHTVLSQRKFTVQIPLRKIEVEISVVPLSEDEILFEDGRLTSKIPFVEGKTLNEESIPFEWKYGTLGVFVHEQIRKVLWENGVVIDTSTSYLHPTNIKVDPRDFTKLTITDLGAKIPDFVKSNLHILS